MGIKKFKEYFMLDVFTDKVVPAEPPVGDYISCREHREIIIDTINRKNLQIAEVEKRENNKRTTLVSMGAIVTLISIVQSIYILTHNCLPL